MAADTSITAYHSPKRRKDYGQDIINLLGKPDTPLLTRLGIASKLGVPINCITAPVLSLIKLGIIVEHDRIVQPETGQKAWALKLK